jgi:hypothetical protein
MKNQIFLPAMLSLIVTSFIGLSASAQDNSLNAPTSSQTKKTATNQRKKIISKPAQAFKKGTAHQIRTQTKKQAALKPQQPRPQAIRSQNTATTRIAGPVYNSGLATRSTMASVPVLKAKISQTSQVEKVSPWVFKYVTVNSLDMNTIENAAPTADQTEVTAWDRFGVTYNLSDKVSASIVAQTYHTWFGKNDRVQDRDNPGLLQPGSFYWGDMYSNLSDSQVYKFAGDVVFSAWTRWYFPTSEQSQKADQIGVWWTDLTLTKSVGIVDLKVHEQPRIYFQKFATSSLFDAAGNPEPLYDYRLYHLLEQDINATSKFSIALTEGLENQHKFADPNPNPSTGLPTPEKYATLIILNPELDYTLNKVWSFALGIWEETALNDSYHPFDASRGDDVSAYLQVNIAL